VRMLKNKLVIVQGVQGLVQLIFKDTTQNEYKY